MYPVVDSRTLLSEALAGSPAARSSVIHRHYAATIGIHSRRFTRLDCALNQTGPMVAAVLPSSCDEAGALARMAGLRVRQAALSPATVAGAPVIVAGCSRSLPEFLPDDFFDRGGTLVTSDRAILDVPLLSGVLKCQEPAPARRVSLLIHDKPPRIPQTTTLATGHVPVSVPETGSEHVRVIASECMTGAPIVLAARIGNGWLLHSVAHWYQDGDVAGDPGAVLGPIRAMSLALLTGLEFVLTSPRN